MEVLVLVLIFIGTLITGFHGNWGPFLGFMILMSPVIICLIICALMGGEGGNGGNQPSGTKAIYDINGNKTGYVDKD